MEERVHRSPDIRADTRVAADQCASLPMTDDSMETLRRFSAAAEGFGDLLQATARDGLDPLEVSPEVRRRLSRLAAEVSVLAEEVE